LKQRHERADQHHAGKRHAVAPRKPFSRAATFCRFADASCFNRELEIDRGEEFFSRVGVIPGAGGEDRHSTRRSRQRDHDLRSSDRCRERKRLGERAPARY
jgi:hypothetical protein